MKKTLIFLLTALILTGTSSAQQYDFRIIIENPSTSLKSQGRTGTCWCFATISFLESELIRMGKEEASLSEMFVVRNTYKTRYFDNYLRRGKGNLGPGSVSHTAINAIARYGLMPRAAYPGTRYDSQIHNHSELQGYINTLSEIPVKMKKISRESEELLDALLDIYLGEVPQTFLYNGKEHTPLSFVEYLGLNMDDYVEITSFSHHPFYRQIPVEIPDNWEHERYYNVPLDEFMTIADYALKKGYTLAWDGDLGKNFSQENGVAVIPSGDSSTVEVSVTQDIRQEWFETFNTTDDHLMHVTGISEDQNGVKYYITKNSWGETGKYKGFVHMSENYFRAKCIGYMIHKEAIPKDIRKKLGL
ncbi:MAG: C1 family peptidase [Bacteroidales bacterium]|nr:C1 family peptidase [Bacteroidales bacterium]MDD3696828.1 C1 family peptidase [Bacteroidales bacterium]MDD4167129.1 C1 family peptidase [Bacteroidales bacterium]MDD4472703.1 C1 family peptidase [Bacteroidales bacterium]